MCSVPWTLFSIAIDYTMSVTLFKYNVAFKDHSKVVTLQWAICLLLLVQMRSLLIRNKTIFFKKNRMVTEERNLNAMKWNLSHAQGFFGRPKELCTTNWRRSFCICLCSCVTLSKFAPTNTSCSVFLHIVGGGWPLLVLLFFVGESFPKEGYRWFEISGNKNVD